VPGSSEKRVIDAGLEIDAEHVAAGAHFEAFFDRAVFVEREESEGSAQHDPRFVFRRLEVAMWRDVAARLNRVEHAVQSRVSTAMKRLNHARARARTRRRNRALEALFGDPNDAPSGRRKGVAHAFSPTIARASAPGFAEASSALLCRRKCERKRRNGVSK
jgi:hypothetical protein